MTLTSLPEGFPDTVRSLHEVAVELLAPARKPDAEIVLRIEGAELVHQIDGEEQRSPLSVDSAAGTALAKWYAFGQNVLDHLLSLASDTEAATQPRLRPEHLDLATELGSERLGTRATYGFSPGDENHPEPYVYVAPWSAPVSGPLWQARGFRGAELGYAELLAAADQRRAALDFLTPRWDLMTIMTAGRE